MDFQIHPRINQRSGWLQTIIDHLSARCGNEISHLEDSDPICLHTFQEAMSIHPERSDMSGTFGFSFITTIAQNKFTHLIVMNQDACNNLNLSIDEIVAVSLHELGHVYNEFPITPFERALHGLDVELKKEYKYNAELRADCFTAKLGFRDELISALTKSLESDLYVRVNNELQRRITELQTDDFPYLDGRYKVALL